MCNLEELKKCRVVYFLKGYYLVNNVGNKFIHLSLGYEMDVCERDYENVERAYKTFKDYLNDNPYFSKEDAFLSNSTKEWLKYVVRSLKDIDIDTLELEVFNDYCNIVFVRYDGENDFITLPNFENIIHNFSKLEKDKIYTFKELGIKL